MLRIRDVQKRAKLQKICYICNMTVKDFILRYSLSTAGICLVAIGIVFSVHANLGISVLNAPAYAFSAKYPAISLGTANFSFFMLCVLFQFIILGKRFKVLDLQQILANFALGLFIDLFNRLFISAGFIPGTVGGQTLFLVLSLIITALGISVEVICGAWMLPADMTVSALCTAFGGKFSNNKVIMDCTILVISAILCLCFFGNILGPAGTPIIGWGTLALAVFTGLCMKLTDPAARKTIGKLL